MTGRIRAHNEHNNELKPDGVSQRQLSGLCFFVFMLCGE